MARYLQYTPYQYQSTFVPQNVEGYAKILEDLQSRQDRAKAAVAARYDEALKTKYINQDQRDKALQRFKETTDNLYTTTGGDYGRNLGKVLSALNKVNEDPFWSMNAAQLESVEDFKKKQDKAGSNFLYKNNPSNIQWDALSDKPNIFKFSSANQEDISNYWLKAMNDITPDVTEWFDENSPEAPEGYGMKYRKTSLPETKIKQWLASPEGIAQAKFFMKNNPEVGDIFNNDVGAFLQNAYISAGKQKIVNKLEKDLFVKKDFVPSGSGDYSNKNSNVPGVQSKDAVNEDIAPDNFNMVRDVIEGKHYMKGNKKLLFQNMFDNLGNFKGEYRTQGGLDIGSGFKEIIQSHRANPIFMQNNPHITDSNIIMNYYKHYKDRKQISTPTYQPSEAVNNRLTERAKKGFLNTDTPLKEGENINQFYVSTNGNVKFKTNKGNTVELKRDKAGNNLERSAFIPINAAQRAAKEGKEYAYARLKIQQGDIPYYVYVEVDPSVLSTFSGSGKIDKRMIKDPNNVLSLASGSNNFVDAESVSVARPGQYNKDVADANVQTVGRIQNPSTGQFKTYFNYNDDYRQAVQDTYLTINDYLQTNTQSTTINK